MEIEFIKKFMEFKKGDKTSIYSRDIAKILVKEKKVAIYTNK